MSAVIVDHEHIHVLIWAASKPIAPPNPTMRWLYDNPTRVNQIEPDGRNRDEIGQILLDENADSLNHLYRNTVAAGDYHYQRPQHTEWSIAELLNALDAYTYQACERPDWERSQAKAFCDALRDRLVSELPGYHAGPWTITPRSSAPVPDGVRWLAFTATLDMIVPGPRSVPAYAHVETVKVGGVGHLGMLLSHQVAASIVAALPVHGEATAARLAG